ncbi:MAG: replication-associated recombination protein A [Acholeplasmataceae bacterium]|nr:replication-associated recombination protein A [Acholeplasmataceae bacterium]
MKPLAYRMRPKSFTHVYGQDHLVGPDGVLSMMLKKGIFLSFILYGPPGTGKTTIAEIFAEKTGLETYTFNASTDSKQKLRDILDTTTYKDILVVVDEIHRMNKDIQDYLLPFIENGKAIIIGLTTLNPYQSVNPAIRSRCHVYEVKKLGSEDLTKAILNGLNHLEMDITIEEKAVQKMIQYANDEVRTALNILESASLILDDGDRLLASHVERVMGKKPLDLDGGEDHYFDLLSALQKSIRGSDVDASLHYLARLLTLEDLLSLQRRLLVIAYEDIGLANPQMGQKVLAATDAALKIGLPEARIILSVVVIEMALSPKSNTALIAIDDALADFQQKETGSIPKHASNREIRKNPGIYHYPHDNPNSINDQSYLPDLIKEKTYYHPKKESAYEKALSERLEKIDQIKGKKRKLR